jgi:hypothetical protein
MADWLAFRELRGIDAATISKALVVHGAGIEHHQVYDDVRRTGNGDLRGNSLTDFSPSPLTAKRCVVVRRIPACLSLNAADCSKYSYCRVGPDELATVKDIPITSARTRALEHQKREVDSDARRKSTAVPAAKSLVSQRTSFVNRIATNGEIERDANAPHTGKLQFPDLSASRCLISFIEPTPLNAHADRKCANGYHAA